MITVRIQHTSEMDYFCKKKKKRKKREEQCAHSERKKIKPATDTLAVSDVGRKTA